MQVAVALGAMSIDDAHQVLSALVLYVATGTWRRERLGLVMRGGLVAAQAGRIGNIVLESDGLHAVHHAHMAGAALVVEEPVRTRERAAAVFGLATAHT